MAARFSELEFLRSLRLRAGTPVSSTAFVQVGIGDDAALLRPRRKTEVVVTTDFSLEGRHFRRDWHTASSAGHRCLVRGLSDLAAMGASPMAAFLSLAIPGGRSSTSASRSYAQGFVDGLLQATRQYGVTLAGGDTATAPAGQILADIVLLGSVPRGRALLRRGAKAGDGIYITGRLGSSAAELSQLAHTPRRFRKARPDGPHPHLFPQPRLAVGQALLRRSLATACMDVSDGLSTDLHHLCEESRTGAIVEADALPLGGTLEQALHGGEDYELLFTSGGKPPATIAGIPITRIGTITSRRGGVRIRIDGKPQPLVPQGWEHIF